MDTPKIPPSKSGKQYRQKRAFLAAYAASGSIRAASAAAKMQRDNHYAWMKDPAYQQLFAEVQDQAAQELEDEAVRRAKEGVKRPVLYKGEPVKVNRHILYEVEYSDQLLIVLLKRFRPQLYREHVTTEISGTIEIAEKLQEARKRLIEMRKNAT